MDAVQVGGGGATSRGGGPQKRMATGRVSRPLALSALLARAEARLLATPVAVAGRVDAHHGRRRRAAAVAVVGAPVLLRVAVVATEAAARVGRSGGRAVAAGAAVGVDAAVARRAGV